MGEDIEIRRYQASDIPVLNEMSKKIYGFALDERFWKWKYEDNPTKRNYSHVAVVDGRIVAHCGAFGVELEHAGERIFARQLGDLMSDPDHRVKGAFSITYFTAINFPDEIWCPMCFGFANQNSTGFSKHTSERVMQGPMVPRLDRITKATPFIRRKIGGGAVSDLLGFPANLAIRSFHALVGVSKKNLALVEEVTEFGPEYDELWNRIGVEFPRTNVRSSRYLSWRYLEHPIYSYKILAYSDREGLKGYVVLRIMEDKGVRRGLIIDLISGLEDPAVWEALLLKAIKRLEGEGAELITCWMFDHMPYYETLKKLHFVNRPSDLSVQAFDRTGVLDLDALNDSKSWYVTMGDSDIF